MTTKDRDCDPLARLVIGNGPLVAAAIHDGHALRDEVAQGSSLSSAQRLREEDPFTGAWTDVAPTRIIGTHSRFQVDLNRPRTSAVYQVPDDAWGLVVWKDAPSPVVVEHSLEEYDAFYAKVGGLFDDLVAAHGRFVVLDLHTYNHRRDGPDAPPADPEANPEVNLGTGTMDRAYWGPLVDRFISDLGSADFMGRCLDVRENVKFRGGAFGRWIHERYPRQGCALAVEFKKFFMDEWTGGLFHDVHAALGDALRSTVPGLTETLNEVARRG